MAIRYLFLSIVPAALAIAQTLETGSVEGHVVTSAGAPLRDVKVQIAYYPPDYSPIEGQRSGVRTYTAQTDENGNFTLSTIVPSDYYGYALLDGYIQAPIGLTVEAGKKTSVPVIRLIRRPVIGGRVLNESGQPVSGAQVQLYRNAYQEEWIWKPAYGGVTDRNGVYRFQVPGPGRYYVSASDGAVSSLNPATEANARTFYPGTTDPAQAKPVRVDSSGEVLGLDFRIQRTEIFKISGKVAGEDVEGRPVLLTTLDDGGPGMQREQTAIVNKADGSFSFARVPPGRYHLSWSAWTPMNKGAVVDSHPKHGGAQAVITVTDHSIEGLQLSFAVSGDMKGSVREGAPRQEPAGRAFKPTILLLAQNSVWTYSPRGNIGEDGTLTIKEVAPGKYRIRVLNSTPGSYPASVRYQGQDAMKSWITVGDNGGGPLDIVMRNDGAELSGIVRDASGEGMLERTVSLWPVSGDFSRPILKARASAGGRYRFQSVPPGEYRVIAWEYELDPEGADVISAPEFVTQFNDQAITVKLDASEKKTQDVTIISRAAIEAAEAKIP